MALTERRIGIVHRIADSRDPALVTHSLASILRARALAIAWGYEDANDVDGLRTDPAFKMARGRLPDSGGNPCSKPTLRFFGGYFEVDGLIGATEPPTTHLNGDRTFVYAGVGPFTLWTIIVEPALNPGLDLSELTDIEIQIVAVARTRKFSNQPVLLAMRLSVRLLPSIVSPSFPIFLAWGF